MNGGTMNGEEDEEGDKMLMSVLKFELENS
jgi:hypothetical protein